MALVTLGLIICLFRTHTTGLILNPEFAGGLGSPNGTSFLAILVGNSKALWTPMIDFFAQRVQNGQELAEAVTDHPVDLYCLGSIREAVDSMGAASVAPEIATLGSSLVPRGTSRLLESTDVYIYDAADTRPGHVFAATKLANLVNLGELDEDAFLCVHPVYGPWFALRAIIVLNIGVTDADLAAMQLPPVEIEDNPDRRRKLKEAKADAFAHRDSSEKWIKLRSLVDEDSDATYGPLQLQYHYDKDLAVFRGAVKKRLDGKDYA